MKQLARRRVPSTTTIMANNRVTIPVAALRRARLKAGDLIVIRALGSGTISFARAKR